jgi:hypothetical protein
MPKSIKVEERFFWRGKVLGFELSFALAKYAVYCLSHTSSPFCSGYSGESLENYLSRLASYLDPLDLSFLSSQDYRCKSP